MKKLQIWFLALLLAMAGYALADVNQTSSQYRPTAGGVVNGIVILQSDDNAIAKPINASNPIPVSGSVTSTPAAGSSQTIGSSTITTGGTFQQITAASAARKSFEFQNICAKSGNCTATTNNCYLYVGGAGTPGTDNSILVQPGASYGRFAGSIPTDAIRATCDGTGDKFYLSTQ